MTKEQILPHIPVTVDACVRIQGPQTERSWFATLPNGKVVTAFVPEEATPPALEHGQEVRVCMTVTDFSRALIVG